MPTLFTDRAFESRRVGGYLNWCFSAGLITNAQVAANATITLLKAAVRAANLFTEKTPMITQLDKALDRGISIGEFTETHGVTTVATLVALTTSSTSHKQGFFG